MAERALQKYSADDVDTIVVASAKTVTKGKPIKHSGADHEAENAAAITDLAIGIALESGTAGQTVRYVRLGSKAIVPALVGTGGATRGQGAVYVADGVTDQATGGGTNLFCCLGQFMQSGVAGDYVGLNLGMAGFSVKS